MEAERIDPQQRHVLDCVHMALEDGGITRSQLNGSQTGVYIGNTEFILSIRTPLLYHIYPKIPTSP